MSEEQQRFDDLMKRVIKVSPEELKRRMAESSARRKITETQSAASETKKRPRVKQ